MPKTIKNDAGEDEEVFTKEELDAAAEEKATEERERLEKENQEALDAAEEEKADLEKQLEGYKDKEINFKKLRDQKKGGGDDKGGETEEEIQKQIKELNEKIEGIGNQSKTDTLNDFIKDKIGDDKDKKEKFDYYYKKLGSEAKTKDEIIAAAKESLTLATGGEYNADNDQSIHSVGASENYRQAQTGEASESAKSMGAKLGITDEDRKKYGKKK